MTILRVQEGWKKTGCGQHYNHYLIGHEPICKTRAIFTTAPHLELPRGWVCKTCSEILERWENAKR